MNIQYLRGCENEEIYTSLYENSENGVFMSCLDNEFDVKNSYGEGKNVPFHSSINTLNTSSDSGPKLSKLKVHADNWKKNRTLDESLSNSNQNLSLTNQSSNRTRKDLDFKPAGMTIQNFPRRG